MFNLLALFVSTLALVPHLGNAMSVEIPEAASHLALDEENGLIIAFHQNGTQLGRYPVQAKFDSSLSVPDAGKCTALKATEVRNRQCLQYLSSLSYSKQFAQSPDGRNSRLMRRKLSEPVLTNS